MSSPACVCVVIAAYNAAATIGDAVRSALAQNTVAEVIVVDDASSDATPDAARAAAAGNARLQVVQMAENGGVSIARNRGIAAGTAPLIALLDADDYYLPDRFIGLDARADWDFFADNIAFVPDTRPGLLTRTDVAASQGEAPLDLAGFATGNMPDGKVSRGELGFLKPVMRRSFLEAQRLHYDDNLRFGEDFDLYVRALIAGARFIVSQRVGYVARVRAGSLSGTHDAGDLARLLGASNRHLATPGLAGDAQAALTRHRNHLRARHALRETLRLRHAAGTKVALRFAAWPPRRSLAVVRGILHDKMVPASKDSAALRYLIPV